jgi:hypothetical protein
MRRLSASMGDSSSMGTEAAQATLTDERGEVDRLLSLAEVLLQRTEQLESRLIASRVLKWLLWVVAAIGVVITLVALSVAHFATAGFVALSIAVLTGSLIALDGALVRPWRRQLDRDRRALSNLVELLRETAGVIVRDWSPLEEAAMRIRLSRFPIGTDVS